MIRMIKISKTYPHQELMNLKMEPYTLGSGNKELDMEEENNIGTMVLSMKGIGEIIWPMVKEG